MEVNSEAIEKLLNEVEEDIQAVKAGISVPEVPEAAAALVGMLKAVEEVRKRFHELVGS